MREETINRFVADSLAIELESAKEADSLGYVSRLMLIASMPYSRPKKAVIKRDSGPFRLYMSGHPEAGLPYGSYPRLLLSWLTTEAVRTRDRHIELGPTLSGFMAELGLLPTGGRWGNIHRLRDQMQRLFSCTIYYEYTDDVTDQGRNVVIAEAYKTWWNPKAPDQAALWGSYVELGQKFFDEIVDKPVPVDFRALKALKRSAMALDIYCWLTYRMSYLNHKKVIPWTALHLQFGGEYTRLRKFKEKFISHLKAVSLIYPEAKVQPLDTGLELRPSKPHVPMLDFR